MGGFGSRGGSPCTDDMQALDVRALDRDGLLRARTYTTWHLTSGSAIAIEVATDRVVLRYQNRSLFDGAWVPMTLVVMLQRTPCHFGGARVWWQCPAAGCARRVAVLYGGRMFACRRCHGLTYRSQRAATGEQAVKQLNKLRRRLGWAPGYLSPNGAKPKGMHWTTFRRLLSQHNRLQMHAVERMEEVLGALSTRIARIRVPPR